MVSRGHGRIEQVIAYAMGNDYMTSQYSCDKPFLALIERNERRTLPFLAVLSSIRMGLRRTREPM